MKFIVCLGNPGKAYHNTRHNVGFLCADYLSQKHNIPIKKLKFRSLYGEGTIAGQRVVLIKPQTYMNLSGEAVREFLAFFQADVRDLLVIFDDISLPLGSIRIRPKGSAGGHNGIKSIIYQLQSDQFERIKVGVGAPIHPEYDLKDFVLSHFTGSEQKILFEAIERVDGAVNTLLTAGCAQAMNDYNAVTKQEVQESD